MRAVALKRTEVTTQDPIFSTDVFYLCEYYSLRKTVQPRPLTAPESWGTDFSFALLEVFSRLQVTQVERIMWSRLDGMCACDPF